MQLPLGGENKRPDHPLTRARMRQVVTIVNASAAESNLFSQLRLRPRSERIGKFFRYSVKRPRMFTGAERCRDLRRRQSWAQATSAFPAHSAGRENYSPHLETPLSHLLPRSAELWRTVQTHFPAN